MRHKPTINIEALRDVLGVTAVLHAERELVKPQVNVAQMWRYFTTSVYTSGDLVSIATREALQNSVDAIRAAVRAGQLKKGEGRFEVHWHPDQRALTWADNGLGMDRVTVRDKFLSLGDSGKAGAQNSGEAAGGFGVAKAVILGISERFEWDLHTRNVQALSRPGADIEITDHTPRQGTKIRIYGIPDKLVSVYSWVLQEHESVEQRVRRVLGVCNLPDIALSFDGTPIEPMFSRRGGTAVATEGDFGPGTSVQVRAFRRSDRLGAFWVRLDGLYQFSKQANTKLPADIVVDLSTTTRPGNPDYPLTASRDRLQGAASNAFYDLVHVIEQENASAGRSQEYEVLLPGEGQPLQDQTEQALSSPEILSSLRAAGQALVASLGAATTPRTLQGADSQAPAGTRQAPVEPVTLDGPLSAAQQLAAGLDPKTLAGALGSPEQQPGLQNALQRLAEGQERPEDVQAVKEAAAGLADRAAAPGGGGLLQAAAVQSALATLPGTRQLVLSPFGSMAGLRISKKNFDARRAAQFKRGYSRWVPLLILWDATLRLVAAQGGIRRAFKPGFVLDDSVKGMAAMERAPDRPAASVIYVHPFRMEEVIKAHRERPLHIAYWLHALACHELTHHDGLMDEGHSENFVANREHLGSETAGLLLPIAQLAVQLLGLPVAPPAVPRSPKANEQRLWALVAALERTLAARNPEGARSITQWTRRNRAVLSLIFGALAHADPR